MFKKTSSKTKKGTLPDQLKLRINAYRAQLDGIVVAYARIIYKKLS